MKSSELTKMGYPPGKCNELVMRWAIDKLKAGIPVDNVRSYLKLCVKDPKRLKNHSDLDLNKAYKYFVQDRWEERETPAPHQIWGSDIDSKAIEQMKNACRLPVAVQGALMPDAHAGYGLPIGGVLATDNAVIPYAVGVDIACRMKVTVLPIDTKQEAWWITARHRLIEILQEQTRFGMGASFDATSLRDHPVLYDKRWNLTDLSRKLKQLAPYQLGSSGGGNHFVEFGQVELAKYPGVKFLGIMSHSGSRGPGSQIANYYSKLAQSLRPNLPPELKHLAWLDMDSEEGQEYWQLMNLMGFYASANHECIHNKLIHCLTEHMPILTIENHHNFAWQEELNGQDVIVHRKGATPAQKGIKGVIPGSMADPAYLVEGLGLEESINSSSHGAGRQMSRKKANNEFNWTSLKELLSSRKVTLISGGLDEAPGAYKNIDEVMSHQSDLVKVIGKFYPKVVKMAPEETPKWYKKKPVDDDSVVGDY